MIAGIDLSTRAVDLVYLDEDTPDMWCFHQRIDLPGGWWHAARCMRRTLQDARVPHLLDEHGVHLAGIERPYSPPAQIGTATKLHTIIGALLASLPQRIVAFEVSPNDMRRELDAPKNCRKDTLRAAVIAQIGEQPWPDDGYDAFAAGYAALRINERGACHKDLPNMR